MGLTSQTGFLPELASILGFANAMMDPAGSLRRVCSGDLWHPHGYAKELWRKHIQCIRYWRRPYRYLGMRCGATVSAPYPESGR
jgi:hypothetical protein